MRTSSEAPRGLMDRFRRWLLAGIGAILLALITAWVLDYFGPSSNSDGEVDRFDVAGMSVECNVSVSPLIGKDEIRSMSEEGNKITAFLVVTGYLLQEVLSKGEALKKYKCNYSNGFYAAYRLSGPSHTSNHGQTCRSYYSSTSLYWRDGDYMHLEENKIRDSRWDACIGNEGLWEPILREELGIRKR